MSMLIIQTLFLLLMATAIGYLLGCLLCRWFGGGGSPDDGKNYDDVEPTGGGESAVSETVAAASIASEEPAEAPAEDDSADAPSSDESDEFVSSGPKPVLLSGAKGGKADNLKRIKGVGPKLEGLLNEVGIYHFDQVAAWSRDNIDWMDQKLSFPGRIDRDNWVDQAAKLAEGEVDSSKS